jgi:hypothetical protein
MKGLLLVAIFQQLELTVCEYAIAIHQEKLDATGAAIEIVSFES